MEMKKNTKLCMGLEISCKLSPSMGDHLHEMSNLIFLQKVKNYFKMLSAEIIIPSILSVNLCHAE